MNEKILEINPPDGGEVDEEKSSFKKIVYKEIKKEIEFPENTIGLKIDNGYFIGGDSSIRSFNYDKIRDEIDFNVLPSEDAAEAVRALCQLWILRDHVRNGWEPYYPNNDGVFSIIYFNNNPRIDIFYNTQHFLSFKTRDIAEKFLNKYRVLIETAKPLL